MERLAELIGKLNEQFSENADRLELLQIIRLIEAELIRPPAQVKKSAVGARVAVVMPAVAFSQEKEWSAEETVSANNFEPELPAEKEVEPAYPSFNPMTEIPTLAHQPGNRELNEMMREASFSLNDKLKAEIVELGQVLTDVPVRDLRKAIGINDRYVFVSELFRGDEVMYERSIKTINGFKIFAEAEYWIERELKIKLGWDDSRDCTAHFYRLVKRRFS